MSFTRTAFFLAAALSFAAAPVAAGSYGTLSMPTLTFPSDGTAPAPLIPSTKG